MPVECWSLLPSSHATRNAPRAQLLAYDFLELGSGPELHEALLARDRENPESSFIDGYWNDM